VASSGGHVDEPQSDVSGVVVRAVHLANAHDGRAVGRESGARERHVVAVGECDGASRRDVDGFETGAALGGLRAADVGSADDLATVGGDIDVVGRLAADQTGCGREVADGGRVTLSGYLAKKMHVRPRRPEVVVPVAHRVGVVKNGGDPGVLARLAVRRIGLVVALARVHAGDECDIAASRRYRHRRYVGRPSQDQAGFASTWRQQPQRRDSLAVGRGILFGIRISSGRCEQQATIREKASGGLAVRAARETSRHGCPGRGRSPTAPISTSSPRRSTRPPQ